MTDKGRYAINSDTHQAHDTRTDTENCQRDSWNKKHIKYVGFKELAMLIREGFDFCDYCFA